MTTTFTAHGPEDLLAAVPLILGFVPHDSLVMLTFAGEHRFHARLDLPPDGRSPTELVQAATALLRPAVANGVSQVAFVAYTADEALSRDLDRALRRVFGGAEIEIVDSLRADGRRWYAADGKAGDEGTPYDLAEHPFWAQSVLAGQVTMGSREELAATVAERPELVGPVESRLREAVALTGPALHELVARHLAAGSVADDEELAAMLLSMTDPDVRDFGWTHMTRTKAVDHVRFWSDVVRRSPPDLVADPAAILAFSAWLSGNGAIAWCALERCFQGDPLHRLGGLIARALEQAVPPAVWEEGPAQRH